MLNKFILMEMRHLVHILHTYFLFTWLFFSFHFRYVYIGDQGGKDPGLGKSGCDHYFQTFYVFFPFLGRGVGGRQEKGENCTQPPNHPSTKPPSNNPMVPMWQMLCHMLPGECNSSEMLSISPVYEWGNPSTVHQLTQSTLVSPFAKIFAVIIWLG